MRNQKVTDSMNTEKTLKYEKIKMTFFAICILGFSQAQQSNGIKMTQESNQDIENDAIPKIVHSQTRNYSTIVLLDNNYTSLATLDLLNPDLIEFVKIEKGNFEIKNKKYTGKIIIETKQELNPTFVTIDQLVKKYIKLQKTENYICSIDGEIVNADKNNTLLDEKNILQIEEVKLDKIESPTNLTLIKILTRNKKKSNNKGGIIIRGNELILNN